MEYRIAGKEKDIAVIVSDGVIITDAQSALDVISSAEYETGCEKFIIDKSSIIEEFFVLSNGIAGEILQKFVNYRKKVAITGDYSRYTSKALKDFIYESNKGNSIYFLPDTEAAIERFENGK